MTVQSDKRRATALMREARTLALDLIHEDVWAPREIAYRSYPLVEYAARLSPKDYKAAEKHRVMARFLDCEAKLSAMVAG